MKNLTTGTWMIILLTSFLRSSIVFLVYEVAVALTWILGIADTEDRKANIVDVHSFCYDSYNIKLLSTISLIIFLYTLISYYIAASRHR